MLFRPARASDMGEICALLATPEGPPEYFHALFTADPRFDPAQIRLACMGNRIIACATIYPRALRIGTMVVPACGVGNVCTEPRHRQEGLATALLGECLTAMYLEGALLAPLFAPRHDLFARCGWHVVPEIWLDIPAGALEVTSMVVRPGIGVRPLAGRDLDATMALHEDVNAARTASAVRERDDWLRCLTVLDLHGSTILVAERADEIVGYVVAQPRNTSVDVPEMLLAPRLIESAGTGRSSEATDVVLSLLRAVLAGHRDAAMVRAGLPADYRRLICDALAPYVTTTERDDLMLRMVDPVRLLQWLAPALSARLRDGHEGVRLAVRIGPLRGGAVLRAARDGVVVDYPGRDDAYALPEATFLALLLGTEGACAQLDNLPLPASMRQTLRRLFPPQDWVFWRSDAF